MRLGVLIVRVGGTQGGWNTGIPRTFRLPICIHMYVWLHTHTTHAYHTHTSTDSLHHCRLYSRGACHMVAMQIAGEPLVRQTLRQVFQSRAVLCAKLTKKGRKVDTVPHARCISSQELSMNLEESNSVVVKFLILFPSSLLPPFSCHSSHVSLLISPPCLLISPLSLLISPPPCSSPPPPPPPPLPAYLPSHLSPLLPPPLHISADRRHTPLLLYEVPA